jgi:DNA-binding beta-propeller fold protein YncE
MAILLTLAMLTAAETASVAAPLVPVADLPLPGGASRFDYQWVDPRARRLYIAHLGAGSLVVFDLASQRVVGEVGGLPSVHGVVAVPERHLLLATVTGEKKLALIDDRSLHVEAKIPAGEYPNGLAYDPRSARVFVSNNAGAGIGVVELDGRRALPGIDVGGGAGNSQYDAGSGHVFATVHGDPVLVEIDPALPGVVQRHRLRGVKTCHGLLIASEPRLAFAACGGAAPRLVIFDLRGGRQMASLPLQPHVDVLAFDSGWHRLYAASSSGMVSVFSAEGAAVKELGRLFVGPNAHTVAADPVSHQVYFPLEDLEGHATLRIMKPSR